LVNEALSSSSRHEAVFKTPGLAEVVNLIRSQNLRVGTDYSLQGMSKKRTLKIGGWQPSGLLSLEVHS